MGVDQEMNIIVYVFAWFALMIVGISNGVLRQVTYGKRLPELYAHQLSTLSAIVLLGALIWLISMKWPFVSTSHALIVGTIWLVMTILFEFIFGRCVAGHSWRHLLNDYNLMKGRVWVLVLIWTATAPMVFYRLSSR